LSVLQDVSPDSLIDRYIRVRQQSLDLCAPLHTEDYQIQPMDDASPPKWHLAHVSWFFETFLLKKHDSRYVSFNSAYEVLFNSYYNGVGEQYPRTKRGLMSRPTLEEVFSYRHCVDEAMINLMSSDLTDDALFAIELGLNHEQQHQELILTDLKYNLGNNPLKPAYCENRRSACHAVDSTWISFQGGLVETGCGNTGGKVGAGFVFDNETPRHKSYLEPFELASQPVTNGEFLAFIDDKGYERPELWLSDGWSYLNSLREHRWKAPLYWRLQGAERFEYGLTGEFNVDPNQPVCHISAYEADAYARWRGCRLPTETEWEHAASSVEISGNFVESGLFHPAGQSSASVGTAGPKGMFGDVWEWTSSSYAPYPGFATFDGALGEYNGKFMANQLVLRGGSCATPASHIRPSYRNFFYPPDRWQFSGLRLARDSQGLSA
jgi:ergothioneine biosynthesis protein EgtB